MVSQQSFTGHYLDIGSSLTFVEDWGKASSQTILALHTAGQNGAQYRTVAPNLASLGYRVLVPDFPGHGRSEPLTKGPVTELSDYAQHCLAVLDRLNINRFYVVGCSIGGKIALEIGIRARERVDAIISMAANADKGFVNVSAMKRELNDVSTPSRMDRTYWGTKAVVGSRASEAQRELIARMHCREDPLVSTSDLIAWGRHDIFDRLQELEAPTLLVAGNEDLWIDASSVERAARQIQDSEFRLLQGIGHYPMEEMGDFAEFVHLWLRSVTKGQERTI